MLVHGIDADLDERVVPAFILSAIAPPVLHRMRGDLGIDTLAASRRSGASARIIGPVLT